MWVLRGRKGTQGGARERGECGAAAQFRGQFGSNRNSGLPRSGTVTAALQDRRCTRAEQFVLGRDKRAAKKIKKND